MTSFYVRLFCAAAVAATVSGCDEFGGNSANKPAGQREKFGAPASTVIEPRLSAVARSVQKREWEQDPQRVSMEACITEVFGGGTVDDYTLRQTYPKSFSLSLFYAGEQDAALWTEKQKFDRSDKRPYNASVQLSVDSVTHALSITQTDIFYNSPMLDDGVSMSARLIVAQDGSTKMTVESQDINRFIAPAPALKQRLGQYAACSRPLAEQMFPADKFGAVKLQ